MNMGKLVLGVNIFDLDPWLQVDSFKQQGSCNSLGS